MFLTTWRKLKDHLWLPKSPTNSKHLSPIIHSCYCSLYFISSSFQRLIGSFPDSLLSHPSSRMTIALWLFPHSYHVFLPTCAFPLANDWLNLWLSLFFKKERNRILPSKSFSLAPHLLFTARCLERAKILLSFFFFPLNLQLYQFPLQQALHTSPHYQNCSGQGFLWHKCRIPVIFGQPSSSNCLWICHLFPFN